jgi:hypothetical protein
MEPPAVDAFQLFKDTQRQYFARELEERFEGEHVHKQVVFKLVIPAVPYQSYLSLFCRLVTPIESPSKKSLYTLRVNRRRVGGEESTKRSPTQKGSTSPAITH